MTLQGNFGVVTRALLGGWAWDSDQPDAPVTIILSANDQVIARVRADRSRKDLAARGYGTGHVGFEFRPGDLLSPLTQYVITARREGDGAHVKSSPAILPATTDFDATMREHISRVLSAVDGTDADYESRLSFLARESENLLRLRNDAQMGPNQREARQRVAWHLAGATGPGRPRVLVISETMPIPKAAGETLPLLSHMQTMQRLDYEVSFAATDRGGDSGVLEAIGIAVRGRPWYDGVEAVLSRHHGSFDLVYVHRLTSAERYTALVRHHQPGARLVFNVGELASLAMTRQLQAEQRGDQSPAVKGLRMREAMAAWAADAVITHSSAEAHLLRQQIPPEKVHVVPWAALPLPTAIPCSDRQHIGFIGEYRLAPDIDAARTLIDNVMPAVAALDRNIRCLMGGSTVPDFLRQTAGSNFQFPQARDPQQIFDRVRVTAAPMAYGAGIRNAVLASLAAGIPCVCTKLAAEGLDLPPALAANLVVEIGDFAERLRRLHDDAAFNQECARAALDHIASFAAPTRIDQLLAATLSL